jgi:hypothetical protein
VGFERSALLKTTRAASFLQGVLRDIFAIDTNEPPTMTLPGRDGGSAAQSQAGAVTKPIPGDYEACEKYPINHE